MTTTTIDTNLALFARLWRGGKFAYYWTASEAKDARNDALEKISTWFETDAALPALPADSGKHGPRHIYFSVNPTNVRGNQYQRAKQGERDIVAINTLFAEFDLKKLGSLAATLDYINSLKPSPSVIVFSGGGYHCYWLLNEPFLLTDDASYNRAKLAQYAWVDFTKSDNDAKDLARVLRVPGTINYKPAYGPNYPAVEIITANFDVTYSLEFLERISKPVIITPPPKPNYSGNGNGHHSDDEATAKACLDRLAAWRCDQYQAWLEVGMSLSGLGDVGLSLWDNWSQSSAKYHPGECEKKWKTFDASHGLALASLVFWAEQDDPQPKASQQQGGPQPGAGGSPPPSAGTQQQTPPQKNTKKSPKTLDYLTHLYTLGYRFRLNLLDDSIEVNGQRITDTIAAKIRSEMRDKGFSHMPPMEDAYVTDAWRNRYNPIRDYLDSLKWDSQPHFDNLCSYFNDTQGNNNHPCPTFATWLKRWMIGAVARVYEQAQNVMLVLDGPQDIGKSYFCRWLCPMPGHFIEDSVNPDNKDCKLRLVRNFVWEVSELGSTIRRADVEALKFFLTLQEVTERKPYGRFDIKKPVLCSLIGTLNNSSGFLNDPTGSRRFLSVTLTGINWGYSALDVSQVWAEIIHLYKNGESWRLSEDEIKARDALNATYEVEDPTLNWLERYFKIDASVKNDFTPTAEIISTLQEMGLRGTTRAIQMSVAGILKAKNLKPDRVGGERGYYGIKRNYKP